MDDEHILEIEVACGIASRQRVIAMRVAAGTRARQAIVASPLAAEFPDIDMTASPLAIFGVPIDDNRLVKDGDRIDVLRPLERDPREARRELAARGLTMGSESRRPDGE